MEQLAQLQNGQQPTFAFDGREISLPLGRKRPKPDDEDDEDEEEQDNDEDDEEKEEVEEEDNNENAIPSTEPKEPEKKRRKFDECLEMPSEEDYERTFGSLCRSSYPVRPPPSVVAIDEISEEQRKAPMPHVPDPSGGAYIRAMREFVREPEPEECHDADAMSDVVVEAPFNPNLLDTFAAEIRMNIYRHLLIHKEPIIVYDNWTKVNRRNGLALHTSVLRTCKRFKWEALSVLYGENTFHYRIYSGNVEADLFVREPEHEGGVEDDGDETYMEDVPQRSAIREEPAINFEEYFHLIRHIIVEPESNRFSPQNMEEMSKIINIFSPRKPGQRFIDDTTGNIHTLTIRFYPIFSSNSWSFASFFEPQSPVITAILRVECQFFQLEFLGERTTTTGRGANQGLCGRRLVADLRALRIQKRAQAGLPDVWAADAAKLDWRLFQARKNHNNILNIGRRFEANCKAVDAMRRTDYGVDDPSRDAVLLEIEESNFFQEGWE